MVVIITLEKVSKIFIYALVGFWYLSSVAGLFQMTNMKCESFNDSWVVVKQCRLHAISRGHTVLNLRVDFLHPAYEITLNASVMMKYIGGYKPFVLSASVDACEFMLTKKNLVATMLYRLFKDFSNINHTCPYEGPQILNRFYPQHALLNLPLPNGDYALLLTWILHKKKIFITNTYFTFAVEDKKDKA